MHVGANRNMTEPKKWNVENRMPKENWIHPNKARITVYWSKINEFCLWWFEKYDRDGDPNESSKKTFVDYNFKVVKP